jgi:CRP-like cAMP-binding protein
MIHPNSPFSAFWNVVMTLSVTYSVIVVTFEICFMEDRDSFALLFMGRLIDILFVLDLLVNFLTCYISRTSGSQQIVQDKMKVARHYLRGFFTVDIVSTCGGLVTWFESANSSSLQNTTLRNLRIMRIARLLKLLRMIKVVQVLSRLESQTTSGSNFVSRGLKLAFLLLTFVHVSACFYHLIGSNPDYAPTDENWLHAHYGEEWANAGLWDRYISSVYWSMATATTVGYGDIVAVAVSEQIYAVIIMWCGSAVFALVVADMTIITQNISERKNELRERMLDVHNFMETYKLPDFMRRSIRMQFEHKMNHAIGQKKSAQAIIKDLPTSLKHKVEDWLKRQQLMMVPFFKNADVKSMDMLVRKLTERVFEPSSLILRRGDVGQEMYFLQKGVAQVEMDGAQVVMLHDNQYFGETTVLNKFLEGRITPTGPRRSLKKQDTDEAMGSPEFKRSKSIRRSANVRAITDCRCYVLHQMDLLEVAKESGTFEEMLHSHAQLGQSEQQARRKTMSAWVSVRRDSTSGAPKGFAASLNDAVGQAARRATGRLTLMRTNSFSKQFSMKIRKSTTSNKRQTPERRASSSGDSGTDQHQRLPKISKAGSMPELAKKTLRRGSKSYNDKEMNLSKSYLFEQEKAEAANRTLPVEKRDKETETRVERGKEEGGTGDRGTSDTVERTQGDAAESSNTSVSQRRGNKSYSDKDMNLQLAAPSAPSAATAVKLPPLEQRRTSPLVSSLSNADTVSAESADADGDVLSAARIAAAAAACTEAATTSADSADAADIFSGPDGSTDAAVWSKSTGGPPDNGPFDNGPFDNVRRISGTFVDKARDTSSSAKQKTGIMTSSSAKQKTGIMTRIRRGSSFDASVITGRRRSSASDASVEVKLRSKSPAMFISRMKSSSKLTSFRKSKEDNKGQAVTLVGETMHPGGKEVSLLRGHVQNMVAVVHDTQIGARRHHIALRDDINKVDDTLASLNRTIQLLLQAAASEDAPKWAQGVAGSILEAHDEVVDERASLFGSPEPNSLAATLPTNMPDRRASDIAGVLRGGKPLGHSKSARYSSFDRSA